MAGNGWQWLAMAKHGLKFMQNTGNGWKWLNVAEDGRKCLEMALKKS